MYNDGLEQSVLETIVFRQLFPEWGKVNSENLGNCPPKKNVGDHHSRMQEHLISTEGEELGMTKCLLDFLKCKDLETLKPYHETDASSDVRMRILWYYFSRI